MVDYNPNFPEVLGLEWLVTRNQTTRVFSGASGRRQRLPSTTAETINALRLSAQVDPLVLQDTYTLIDICEEGNELTPLFKERSLKPNGDAVTEGWVTDTGATTNLFEAIDDSPRRWPSSTTQSTFIQNVNDFENYECSVDASAFDTGGAAENARIGFVAVNAILGANTGFRKLRVALRHNPSGVSYAPAGGNLRDVHGFGATYAFWWGELNPRTELPWTPADIASFDIGGDWAILVRSQTSNSDKYPIVYALALDIVCVDEENREAVGVWRRPEDGSLTDRLEIVETDELLSMPAGTAGWSKPSGTNHTYFWRQSVAPALFGPVNADDVRWSGAFQHLGPGGEPPGVVFPLTASDIFPDPDGLASDATTYDSNGRPVETFKANSRAAYGIAPIDDLGDPSVDSQPYRLDLADVVQFSSTSGITGQRVTPASSQDYLGVRFPIIPPFADTEITVTVHRVSDGLQFGGEFTISSAEIGDLPHFDRIRYVTGFLDSGASLVGGTQYEIRVSSALLGAGVDNWIMFGPDCSLAPEASFGGDTDGAVIDGTHDPNRDLCINLLRQPDPPTNVVAAIANTPVTTSAGSVATVEHVGISWDAPAVGMGVIFSRYELERTEDNRATWQRVANINDAATLLLPDDDHEVPRDVEVIYRVRAVGKDGRISMWAESNPITPTAPGSILILTSNHDPSLEVVHLYDPESTYPILSNDSKETVTIYGSDNQVVFQETDDRGTGWNANVWLNQVTLAGRGGVHVLTPILTIAQSLDIPYVAVMDHQGTRILGDVTVDEPRQAQPQHRYTAAIRTIPTHSDPTPVEVD